MRNVVNPETTAPDEALPERSAEGSPRSTPKAEELPANQSSSRRVFLKNLSGLSMTSLLGTAALLTNSNDAQAKTEWAEWFQSNYRLMTDSEKADARARLERRYSEEYAKRVTVDGTPAQDGVLFGYALNIKKCIGCRRCVDACVTENNQSRGEGKQIEWIRVLKLEKGEFTKEKMKQGYPVDYGIQSGGNADNPAGDALRGEHYYHPEKVPEANATYLPMACMQCEDPPCVKVCPAKATYREPDGLVVIDYNWCIGCRMCMMACPYWARRFNFTEPHLPREAMNPATHYLGNRPRMRGVVEKCTWCIQRIRNGRYPACVEVCPVGARKFGNLLDPESEVSRILARKKVMRLKAELNTYPKFFYFYD